MEDKISDFNLMFLPSKRKNLGNSLQFMIVSSKK